MSPVLVSAWLWSTSSLQHAMTMGSVGCVDVFLFSSSLCCFGIGTRVVGGRRRLHRRYGRHKGFRPQLPLFALFAVSAAHELCLCTIRPKRSMDVYGPMAWFTLQVSFDLGATGTLSELVLRHAVLFLHTLHLSTSPTQGLGSRTIPINSPCDSKASVWPSWPRCQPNVGCASQVLACLNP